MRTPTAITWSAACLAALTPQSAGPPAGDVEALRQMAGCFQVTYRFVEDGEHDALSPDYGLEDPLTEWIALERRGEGSFIHLHVGVFDGGRLMPHFHETWDYRPADGRWRHRVFDRTPDDPARELRYACESAWERNRWECAAGRAEKPFRDSGAPFGFDRRDYDWLDRTNILLVTPRGWVHNEHNRKMKEDGTRVSYELGWITYERVEKPRCGAAPEEYPGGDRRGG